RSEPVDPVPYRELTPAGFIATLLRRGLGGDLDALARRRRLALTTDHIHQNSRGAALIAEVLDEWLGHLPRHRSPGRAASDRAPTVVVLGGGSWGTTVANICARRGPTLQWVRSEETARDINENHRNSRYLGEDVVLTPDLRATTDFSEAANSADVVVMGVPSHGFRAVLTELARELRPWVPVVSLVKGLEQGTNLRMSQIVNEVLPGHPAGILAGPNIAREVAEGYAAAAVLAMPDQEMAAYLAR